MPQKRGKKASLKGKNFNMELTDIYKLDAPNMILTTDTSDGKN